MIVLFYQLSMNITRIAFICVFVSCISVYVSLSSNYIS
nr:MAG TPA: hypothetical protein [Bacteriophage sp.]